MLLKERHDFKMTSLNNVHVNIIISKASMQSKNVSYSMHTNIKGLQVGRVQSVQNLSLSRKHVNPSVMYSFGPHSDIM